MIAMHLTLSWDLFIIVFFAIVVTYTFIIGKKESVKIIVSTYIAIVAVQGIGNVLQRFVGDPTVYAAYFGIPSSLDVLSLLKLVLFVAVMIFLAVRAGFEMNYTKDTNVVVGILITILCGVATAALLLSTLLAFTAGTPLLAMNLAQTSTFSSIINQSQLLQFMVVNQDLCFSFPALLLIGVGFLSNDN